MQQRRHRPAAGAAVRDPLRPRPNGDRRQSESGGQPPRSRTSITRALDEVASLDHDRILRSLPATVIRATLRTNFYQRDPDGQPKSYLSFKLRARREIPELPEPRPQFEIFVYSPRVEGVHLRFGAGGPRRPALVGPPRGLPHRGARPGQGADGEERRDRAGRAPRAASSASSCPTPSDREAWLAEGVACYKTFISGLLDLTDNLAAGETVPPERVVRHDGDDPYLVVAADKGTATFSDIANGVAKDYGFWLGDAFASGGSVGYDHKAMGITARGAWESVRRHFREMGVDCQTEDFTCVGVGDMSGDVFGNGMLLSEHIRLVAAFDHRRHLPRPRRRTPPRRTPSAGGCSTCPARAGRTTTRASSPRAAGSTRAQAKSIPVSPQVRAGARPSPTTSTSMTPPELMRAILPPRSTCCGTVASAPTSRPTSETDAEVGRQGQRRHPRQRRGAALPRASARAATSGLTQQRPHRVRPGRRPDQHRLHRQLGRVSTPPTTR